MPSLQAIAGVLFACGISAAPAQAGPNRTFVSGHGTDSGVCTLAAPCRTFAFALTQTAAGGEIDVIGPAGYGAVTIAKTISIVNDGVGTAGITAGSGGTGVTINAGPSDSVHLRGLIIEGGDIGLNGIVFATGGNLAIENCVILGSFIGAGIQISPSTSSSFSVSNTIASNTLQIGIYVTSNSSAVVTGVLSKVITNNNSNGIYVNGANATGGSLNVTIVDSVASNNGAIGILTGSAAGAAATTVMVRNSVVSKLGARPFNNLIRHSG
jgi:hypothetical protein